MYYSTLRAIVFNANSLSEAIKEAETTLADKTKSRKDLEKTIETLKLKTGIIADDCLVLIKRLFPKTAEEKEFCLKFCPEYKELMEKRGISWED